MRGKPERINDFRGLQTMDPDPIGGSQFATEAYNVEFLDGAVKLPRPGMGRYFDLAPNLEVRAAYPWVNSSGKFIILFGKQPSANNAVMAIYNPDSNNPTISLISSGHAGESAQFAEYGEQLFMTITGSDQYEADLAYVFTIASGVVTQHIAFPAPLSNSFAPTVSTSSIGFCTYGTHYLGFVPEYTDGHLGRASPDNTLFGLPNDSTFAPVPATVVNIGTNPNGGGSITLTWTAMTWPSNVQAIHIIMTPVTNNRDYRFVSNGRVAITPGALQTVAYTVSLGDPELLQRASAEDHLFFRTHGPGALNYAIHPYNVFTAGSRVFWMFRMPGISRTISTVVASIPKNPQGLLLDTGSMVLPDGGPIRCGIGVTGGVVLAGDRGVYEFTDTGDPVSWPSRAVDESRGCLTVNGILEDKSAPTNEGRESSASKYWILLRDGLIHTSGYSINQRTMTERARAIWGRINWRYGNKIQMVDIPGKFNLYIMAPFDSATEPTHVIVVHYYRGKFENQVDISLMQVGGYTLGALMSFPNYNTSILPNGNFRDELMVFSRTANAYVLRQKEVGDYDHIRSVTVNAFTDDSGATPYTTKIPHVYATGLIPQGYENVSFCGPYDILLKGQGTLKSKLRTNPRGMELAYDDISIPTGEPGIRDESFVRNRLVKSRGVNLIFQMDGAGEWCEMSALTTYSSFVSRATRNAK